MRRKSADTGRSDATPGGADVDGLEDAQREVHELREDRARIGTVGRELELRALAVQHRASYTSYVEAVEAAARQSRAEGWPVFRRFLETHSKADAHLLSTMNPVASWLVRMKSRSPIYVRRMAEPGTVGAEERARLEEYIEENGLRPAFERLWRQLGGADQESLPT